MSDVVWGGLTVMAIVQKRIYECKRWNVRLPPLLICAKKNVSIIDTTNVSGS